MSGYLRRLFFPTVCPLCGTLKKSQEVDEQGCCQKCFTEHIYPTEKARLIAPEFTPFCGEIFCLSYYEGLMKSAMIRYKFSEEAYMGPCFGRMMYQVLSVYDIFQNIDIITAVPISKKRFKERGYNQSLLISKEIAKLSGLPFVDLLERNIQGDTQSSLLWEERQKGAADHFIIKNDIQDIIKGKIILLVDDILTTGSTINSCAKLLRDAGAGWIIGTCVTGGRKDFI